MNNEILEVIKKSLPEATSGALKEYLEKAKWTEAALENAKKDIALLHSKNDELTKKNEEFKSLYMHKLSLDEREDKLIKSENNLKVTLAEAQAKAAEARANAVFSLAEIVFKNPRLTYNDSGSSNGSTSGQYSSHNFTRAITTEEVK